MNKTVNIRGELKDFQSTWVMGIVNSTPDSFYARSRCEGEAALLGAITKMVTQGATIIDVGGYSTRPGAPEVSEEEEWLRIERALKLLKREFPHVQVSVDTFRSELARRAVTEYAVDWINDISGGDIDAAMWDVVAQLNVGYIAMHTSAPPAVMQQHTNYTHLLDEIIIDLARKRNELYSRGVKDVIIDPGFGFGKSVEQNFEILNRLHEFEVLECPLLVGVSRKSMIYKTLEITPEESLNGSTVVHTLALTKGANILRVHDVKEAVDAVRLYDKMRGMDIIH